LNNLLKPKDIPTKFAPAFLSFLTELYNTSKKNQDSIKTFDERLDDIRSNQYKLVNNDLRHEEMFRGKLRVNNFLEIKINEVV
jgi:hypothetical protein